MNRRFFQRCLVWLLPLLVVQSLVPVGFMATASERGVEIAFCPVQSARVVSTLANWKQASGHDHAHHAAHAGHGLDAAHDSTDARSSSACPYALSGPALTADIRFVIATSFVDLGVRDSTRSSDPPTSLLIDSNRIRGPPRLS